MIPGMDMTSLSLPEWLPWWAVLLILVPVALYLALFLMMPFHTFGLRARLGALEGRIDELQEEIRALTLRLPERGMGGYDRGAPPIPPAAHDGPPPRGGFGDPAARSSLGDPVADRMLAYMKDKAQSELMRGELMRGELTRGETVRGETMRGEGPRPAPRARTEPSLGLTPGLRPPTRSAEPDLPPPPAVHVPEEPPAAPARPPRVPGRFGRVRRDGEDGDAPPDWQR